MFIDSNGLPHFTINDAHKVQQCKQRKLCGLCGKFMHAGYWFIGGPRCFLEERGAFMDPPMCEPCARFAIRTCPFLAAPNYGKRIDEHLSKRIPASDPVLLVKDASMPLPRPDTFMLGHTKRYTVLPGVGYFRAHGWTKLETWQHGRLVDPTANDLTTDRA